MPTFDYLVKFLTEKGYTFYTYIDNNLCTREICVQTENEMVTLCYRFDKYGAFEKMWYTNGNYDRILTTMLWCNLLTNQFHEISAYYGGTRAKAKGEAR